MTKMEFMKSLEKNIYKLNIEQKKDILFDIEEHFNIAIQNGRDEQEVCQSLGSPKAMAAQYVVNSAIDKAESTLSIKNLSKAIGAVVGLGFFNLIFALAPIICIFAFVFSVLAIGVSFIFAGGLASFLALFFPLTQSVVNFGTHPVVVFFGGLVILNIGVLIYINCKGLFLKSCQLLVKYLRWNVKIIAGGKNNE